MKDVGNDDTGEKDCSINVGGVSIFAESKMTFEAGSRPLGSSSSLSKGTAGLMELLYGLKAAEGIAQPDSGQTNEDMEDDISGGLENSAVF